MRMILAYENSLSRDFAAHYLAGSDPMLDIHSAASLAQSIALANRLDRLDVVALDLGLQDLDGLAGLRRFKRDCRHDVPVVLTGARPGSITVSLLASAGGAGFLPYHMSAEALIGALRLVAAGERYVPAEMVTTRGVPQSGITLTMRERDVLSGLRSGLSNKEIADNLSLSEVTVKHHIKSLRGKLGARNRVHAVCRANELDIT